jgi:glycosyltransferase involved in cell wall biosynthesis
MDYPDGEFPYKLAFLNAHAERVVLSRADHCIAHNESAKQIFSHKGFHNITVIPPPVDMTIFKPHRDKRFTAKLGLKSFIIGYIGRFIHEKGIDVLLQAGKLLDFDYQLLIVGDGPAKSRLVEHAKELGVNDRVVWGGPVRHSEIPAYLNVLDVLVLASRTGRMWKEQFGRILVEAMACGVPVIGSTSGEIPKVIGDAGLVFKEEDPSALALGLQKVHSEAHLRSELRAKGLNRVEKFFSVSRAATQYYQVFRSLVS